MAKQDPQATLEPQFSSEGATPIPWATAHTQLEQAAVYWLTTVRPEGRPHITSLIAVWVDGALYFCTGAEERKAQNLRHNPQVALTTGCNVMEGMDLVVEGTAAPVSDNAKLQRVAAQYLAKYPDWHFEVRDGAFYGDGGRALVYEVAPTTIFAFGKGDPFSQTRYRFYRITDKDSEIA